MSYEKIPLIEDNENQAVRAFLMLFGQPGLTTKQMRKHLIESGYPFWPDAFKDDDQHLSKQCAQFWLKYLFDCEKPIVKEHPSCAICGRDYLPLLCPRVDCCIQKDKDNNDFNDSEKSKVLQEIAQIHTFVTEFSKKLVSLAETVSDATQPANPVGGLVKMGGCPDCGKQNCAVRSCSRSGI